jgi:hypothetical protein
VGRTAAAFLLKRLRDTHEEIRGLNKRRAIERETWQSMLKALVSPDGFTKLEKLLNEFIAKLGR